MRVRKWAHRVIIGLATTLVSVTTIALPISVTDGGADITVSYDISGQTVSFDYLFAMGATGAYIGTTMDALSIQFGGNNNALVASISATSTNSATVIGSWTGFRDKVSGNGCSAGMFDAACYTRLGSGVGGSGMETVITANTSYLFELDVIFKTGVDLFAVLDGYHSIKFLSLKLNERSGKWSTGVQTSEQGAFYRNPGDPDPDPDPNPVPVPGTLMLLGLGLLGLRLAGRKTA